jgi:hypothetical protein
MTTKKIPINEGSVKQLRYHAETVLGLELAAVGLNRGQIIAKIEAAAPGTTEITVEAEQDSPAQEQAEQNTATAAAAASVAKVVEAEKTVDRLAGMSAKQAAQHHNDPTIELYIPKSNEAGGDRDVPVSVNGMQWLIQREKWIKVPYRVFVALKHAEETKYDHTNNDIGQMQVTERQVPSYFFQTRDGPSETEIDAWLERTQAVELA